MAAIPPRLSRQGQSPNRDWQALSTPSRGAGPWGFDDTRAASPRTRARAAITSALWLALCGSPAGGCGEASGDAVDERVLRGRVVDDLSGAGIGGATVVFVSDTLDESRTRTDGRGRFEMTLELRAQVRLGHVYAQAEGYQESARRSVLFDTLERTAELRLRPVAAEP